VTDNNVRQSLTEAFLSTRSALARYVARFFVRREDIEDTVQDTYANALALADHAEIESPEAYLFRVARNIALNKRARQRRVFFENLGSLQELIVFDETPPADEGMYWKGRVAALSEAIDALPPQCRKVFILQRIEGLSYKQVAAELGISVRTVEKHLEKALRRCASFIAERAEDVADEGGVTKIEDYRSR